MKCERETETKTIRELCELVVDCPHSTPTWTSQGKIVVRNNNIKNGRIDLSSPSYTDEEHYKQRTKRAVPRPGDIIITREAPIGEVGMIPDGVECCLGQRMVLLRPNLDICNNYYLLYSLQSRFVQHQISWSEGTGTTVSNLRIPHLEQIKIPYLPLEEQEKISSILRVLDEKINLNRGINANLQQQAQAIFKSWFVDFEPFQDGEFVESELGLIPKEWRVGTLSELVAVKYGKDHKKLADGPYPVYGSGGIMRYVERPIYTKESVLIPRKGTLNNVIYLNEPFWSVDTMFYTEMKMENVAKYVYHFVSGKDLASMNSGSAVPSMTTDILNSMKLVIPTAEWLAKFEQILLPLYSQMFQNAAQSKNLAQLRDTLLPKLMNGGIEATP